MGAVAHDAVEEGLALDALAHQPALHVRDGHDDRVDLAVADHLLEFDEAGVLRAVALIVVAHGRNLLPGGSDHFAVMPPSATMTEPVTNDDSSDARKSATLAISRGSPGRPIGWNESMSA